MKARAQLNCQRVPRFLLKRNHQALAAQQPLGHCNRARFAVLNRGDWWSKGARWRFSKLPPDCI
jgi:hypothetical protein